jgi:hypothetical protein
MGKQCVAGQGVVCANKGLWGDSLRTVLMVVRSDFFPFKASFICHLENNTPLDLAAYPLWNQRASGSVCTQKSNTLLDSVAYYDRGGGGSLRAAFVGRA